jgi:hypothetical protein
MTFEGLGDVFILFAIIQPLSCRVNQQQLRPNGHGVMKIS